MKGLLSFAFWVGVGYLAVSKLAPAVQARIESIDIDSVWELWDAEDWM